MSDACTLQIPVKAPFVDTLEEIAWTREKAPRRQSLAHRPGNFAKHQLVLTQQLQKGTPYDDKACDVQGAQSGTRRMSWHGKRLAWTKKKPLSFSVSSDR